MEPINYSSSLESLQFSKLAWVSLLGILPASLAFAELLLAFYAKGDAPYTLRAAGICFGGGAFIGLIAYLFNIRNEYVYWAYVRLLKRPVRIAWGIPSSFWNRQKRAHEATPGHTVVLYPLTFFWGALFTWQWTQIFIAPLFAYSIFKSSSALNSTTTEFEHGFVVALLLTQIGLFTLSVGFGLLYLSFVMQCRKMGSRFLVACIMTLLLTGSLITIIGTQQQLRYPISSHVHKKFVTISSHFNV